MIRLSIPPHWVDEYIDPHDRVLSDLSEAELTEIVLSHPERATWLGTIRPEEVEKDLADGLSMERRQGGSGPYFVLSGSRFDVFVETRIALGDVTQAKITSVRPARGLGRTEAVVPAGVRLVTLRLEQPCDVERLSRIMDDGRRVVRRRRGALARARHGLRRSTPAARPRSDLHAEVRRRYRPLLQLLGLLEHRATLRDEAAGGAGVVVDGPDVDDRPATWIRLDEGTTIGRARAVLVSPADGSPPSNLRPRPTSEPDDSRLVALSAARPRLRPGTPVRLRPYDGFALDKHRKALGRLLDDDIEGDWEHLALLLCAPERLPVVPIDPLQIYFDTSLSPEQQAAVDGAVGSPHAYHLHGPPGTGKTTVITEIVRQLTDRGERVLLLAPMHVAVDEVMSRVADQPGILALRIAADETKVDQRMRRYLPEQVARTFLDRARRPATSRADEWRARLTAAGQEQERTDGLLAAVEAHGRVVAERTAAVAAHRHWHEQAVATEGQARQRCAAVVDAVRNVEIRLAEATRQLLELQSYRASMPPPGRIRGWLSAVAGAQVPGSHAQLDAQLRAVQHHRDQLVHEHGQASAARDATFAAMRDIQEQHPRTSHELAARERALDSAVLAARARLDAAAERMHRTVIDPTAFAVGQLHGRSATLAAEIGRLRYRIALEQRWFELSGLDRGVDDGLLSQIDADLRRSANLMCCTTTGLPRDLGDSDFDTLVVDEASRVVDSEFLIGAVRAQRWVLVGDEHQLPPYVETDDEHFLHAVAALHQVGRGAAPDVRAAVERLGRVWIHDGDQRQFRADAVEAKALELLSGDWTRGLRQRVDHAFSQLRDPGEDPERVLLSAMSAHLVRSLFERNAAAPTAPRSRLTMQHRMIEPIAALVREPVYGGQYLTPKAPKVEPLLYSGTNTPVVFVDTSIYGSRALARQVDSGFVNDLEAELIVTMCRNWDKRLTDLQHDQVSVSVLAFYKKQAQLITKQRTAAGHDFRTLHFKVIDSIDKIQGQQSDLVFVSFCRTTDKARPSADFGRWLQDLRRLNVACTRARRSLVLVGHAPTLRKLNGVPAAEAFYHNLFGLLAERTDVMTMTKGAT